jgi:hypothetical protein
VPVEGLAPAPNLVPSSSPAAPVVPPIDAGWEGRVSLFGDLER